MEVGSVIIISSYICRILSNITHRESDFLCKEISWQRIIFNNNYDNDSCLVRILLNLLYVYVSINVTHINILTYICTVELGCIQDLPLVLTKANNLFCITNANSTEYAAEYYSAGNE